MPLKDSLHRLQSEREVQAIQENLPRLRRLASDDVMVGLHSLNEALLDSRADISLAEMPYFITMEMSWDVSHASSERETEEHEAGNKMKVLMQLATGRLTLEFGDIEASGGLISIDISSNILVDAAWQETLANILFTELQVPQAKNKMKYSKNMSNHDKNKPVRVSW
ncbi:MAG: hypothetical protein M3Q81_04000 [bacterium]|nr:hypothetical protein [bacterium]